MLVMVVDLQEGHQILKGSLLRMKMCRRRLGMEMYKELYELLRHEMLQMFSATTAMLKVTMHDNVLNQEFKILSTLWNKCYLQRRMKLGLFFSMNKNDFLLADPAQMEELKELSTESIDKFHESIILQSDHEQTYLEQHEIINSIIGNDQINSDIIFDDPNVEVNDGKVEHDKNSHDAQDNALELLARNAYKEAQKQSLLAKKVKQQNVKLTKQLEQYKETIQ
ncbi:hypothetical protein Tco_0685233, partial [Tanacetum coccineum]